MSKQRDRIRKSLADDLQKASITDPTSDFLVERWRLVADRIDLLIDAALLERATEGKRGSNEG